MKTFSYRGYDAQGRTASGMLEALDIKDAREQLARRGILAEQVGAAGHSTKKTAKKAPFTTEDRSVFYRELQALLRAGLPLTQALGILIDAPELQSHKNLFAAIRDRIREGDSLASALRSQVALSSFEDALLQAGSESGTMVQVLDQLAEFLEDQKRIADRIKTAMVYPMLVLVLAMGIGIFILGFLLPKVQQLLLQSRMELPLLTRIMFVFGSWAGKLLLPIGAGVTGLILYVRHLVQTNKAVGLKKDRWILRLPVIGPIGKALVKLRFSRTLALLLRGGVPLAEGLKLAGKSTGNQWVETGVINVSEEVQDGQSLGRAIKNVVPLNEDLPGWITAGEASGDLPRLLDSAGNRFQAAWDRALTRFLALFEPVLILLVGLFVFLVALAVLLPLVQINKGLM